MKLEKSDNAMLSIENGHWKNITFDGCPADVTTIKCGEGKLLNDDYEKVKKILKINVKRNK